MEGQQAEWNAERHQHLHLRHVREQVRAEREADRGDRRRSPVSDQVTNEVVGADRGHEERQQDG